jgi:hypothetical protein
MLPSEKLAVAAHLHVLLRRKAGRVTDMEWMASNDEYAREVVRFSRQKAEEDGHDDLKLWADKLELALGEPQAPAKVPLVDRVGASLKRAAAPAAEPPAAAPETGFFESTFGSFAARPEAGGDDAAGHREKPEAPTARYVRGLR